ncbi:response regulator transcription factor [Fertoebacter nigrum]|uniref:Response regulator transcription factor n=1 Tax=Fertoeibacter niger TaxID=2656921 RepID=A0A8X8GW58_9RHOB|nr:response regulator transcription factor [Fertoeibacter niger]NUB45438.1 response regulator transcription factor [Fertoeibacter niger]
MRVLILDDDEELGGLMQPVLAKYGMDLSLAFTPSQAFEQLDRQAFDALLLDMMLPELDGMSVCRTIRASGKPYAQISILALTARAELTDRIVALESGIDDFVAKPVEMRELVARIGAVVRRHRDNREPPPPVPEPQVHSGLSLSPTHMSAVYGTFEINLTELELRILQPLSEAGGAILSRAEILERIGYDTQSDPGMIDTIIYRVRQKFRDQGLKTDFIKTLRGQGYCIRAE